MLRCCYVEMLRCLGIEPLVISLGVFLGVSICTTIERRKGYREIVLLTPFNKIRESWCLLGGALVPSAPTKQKEHQQSKRSTNRMVGALLALASGKAERSPSLTTLLVLPDSNSFLYFRSKTSRKVIVTRTESDRTADGIRSDGERNLIGRRTESDWTADANGEKSLGCVSLEMSVEPKINPEVHFYWASGRIFMLFAVLPDSNN